MPKGQCPDCGTQIQVEKRGMRFECPNCGTQFEMLQQDGHWKVRRARPTAAFAPTPAYIPAPKNTAAPLDYQSSVARASSPRSSSPAPKQQLEVLPRVGRFVILFMLWAAILLIYPAYQLSYGYRDMTLPGIGTLESRPKIEQDNLTATTTAEVLEVRIMEHRRRANVTLHYEVRYRFVVKGVTYSYTDDMGRDNLWADIDKDEWDRVAGELDAFGQSAIMVRYVVGDPADNRPVAAKAERLFKWELLFFGLCGAGLYSLADTVKMVRHYLLAKEAAKAGLTAKLGFWEITPKKS